MRLKATQQNLQGHNVMATKAPEGHNGLVRYVVTDGWALGTAGTRQVPPLPGAC